MAVVLPSDENTYFSPSLRRSHSQTKFMSSPYSTATPTLGDPYSSSRSHIESSPSSSAPSSPRTIHAESASDFSSYPSTPATNLSIASDFEETLSIDQAPEDHFSLPLLEEKYYIQSRSSEDDNLEPPPSPRTGHSYSVSPEQDSCEDTTRPSSPECTEHAEDDTALVIKPSRQVDYLSHEWREEDIWSSWRYIVNRRSEYANSARLENASWRSWMKAKNNLRTISPENLNWLKDCDVTWLYGPLQSSSRTAFNTQTQPTSQNLSKSDSLVNLTKKPILKKRSMSEVMLQRSLSAASLLKQATAAVQAQESRGILRPSMQRAHTSEYVTLPISLRGSSHDQQSSRSTSIDSSGITSPSVERKHISFNEQVEQCIALDVKEDEEEDVDMEKYDHESDSSDEGVMMKRMRSRKGAASRTKRSKKRSKSNSMPDSKTIAMLPSTTLKYRQDTPEPPETALKHSTGVAHSASLSPSSSQETLRPAKGSPRFYLGEEDDGDLGDDIVPSVAGWRSPSSEMGLHRSASTNSLTEEPVGMRRTASGMFMPLEEGEASASDGIFGRVIDSVNTARDIAHVIWNVGWRK